MIIAKELRKLNVFPISWGRLVVRWDTPPVFHSQPAGGKIYTYVLEGTTRYRFIPSPYVAVNDAFYSDAALTQLITHRDA